MNIFNYDDYKLLVLNLIDKHPEGKRGQFQRLSEHLGIHSSMISQIFKGPKDLSLEQACLVCHYFSMTALEEEFFITLVQYQRAGNQHLLRFSKKKLEEVRAKSRSLENRLPRKKKLSPTDQAIFYSHWYFSAMRLLSEVPGYQTIDDIANYFSFPKVKVREITDFLIKTGLCIEQNGKIQIGPLSTHVGSRSQHVTRHHLNWRNKVSERIPKLSEEELAFTCPMTIAEKDLPKLREVALEFIGKMDKLTDDTEPEMLTCFNVDLVKIEG